MSGDRKYCGDSGSVGEELMVNVSELEETGAVVDKAVHEGYFSLPEALSAYRLSEMEYFAYLILKNKGKLGVEDKEKQLVGALYFLVAAFQAPSASFDAPGKKVMKELETIVHTSPLRDDKLFVA
jgi:hypothetical protein